MRNKVLCQAFLFCFCNFSKVAFSKKTIADFFKAERDAGKMQPVIMVRFLSV